MLETDVEAIFRRTGGRSSIDFDPEPLTTMTEVQVNHTKSSSPAKLSFNRSHSKHARHYNTRSSAGKKYYSGNIVIREAALSR